MQILADHSDQLHDRIGELVSLVGISGPEADSLVGLADTRLQFLLSDSVGVTEERERSVWFRDSLDLNDGNRVLVGSNPHDEVWTSWGAWIPLCPQVHFKARPERYAAR
jgi:hypothetical protein